MYFTIVRLMYSQSFKNSNKILKTSIIAFNFLCLGLFRSFVTTLPVSGNYSNFHSDFWLANKKNNDGSTNEQRRFKLFLLMPTICNAIGLHTEQFLAVETTVDV